LERTMSALVYLVAYAGTIVCAGLIAMKVMDYLKKPQHVRWELYPVPHEPGRGSYGGSYLEDVNWWKEKRRTSFVDGIKALLTEMLFMHATFEHNPSLWYRTYPFHFGLYMLLGGLFLTIFAALAQIAGVEPGGFFIALGNLVQVLSFVGLLGVGLGATGLLCRRLHQQDLRKYSTREHYLNLAAFILLSVLGLLAWLSSPSFFAMGRTFLVNMLCFSFAPQENGFFTLFLLWGFILAAYVPATHMGHFFMKYFMWHDIRWSDEPTLDNAATQERINAALGYPVSWSAPHIQGDGKKSWAEVAMTNPARKAGDTAEKK
jgi:nitrate reductase gamma subunit